MHDNVPTNAWQRIRSLTNVLQRPDKHMTARQKQQLNKKYRHAMDVYTSGAKGSSLWNPRLYEPSVKLTPRSLPLTASPHHLTWALSQMCLCWYKFDLEGWFRMPNMQSLKSRTKPSFALRSSGPINSCLSAQNLISTSNQFHLTTLPCFRIGHGSIVDWLARPVWGEIFVA